MTTTAYIAIATDSADDAIIAARLFGRPADAEHAAQHYRRDGIGARHGWYSVPDGMLAHVPDSVARAVRALAAGTLTAHACAQCADGAGILLQCATIGAGRYATLAELMAAHSACTSGAWRESATLWQCAADAPADDAPEAPADAPARRWHVMRRRIADSSMAAMLIGRPRDGAIGAVRYSRTYRTRRAAEREAAAWQDTADWIAEVRAGYAPRGTIG